MKLFGMVNTGASTPYTRIALESFFRHTSLAEGERLLLIDNDGEDIPPDWRSEAAIDYRVNEQPRSFATNVNAGIAMAEEMDADLYFLNNDLVFTPGWLQPLTETGDRIALPVSNVEYQYRAGELELVAAMDLEHYLGREAMLDAVAAAHSQRNTGFRPVYRAPYFCVRLPRAVYRELGQFDESFGPGGAEDMDYSLRAILAGIPIGQVLDSYLLHFHGKSTWRGAESPQQTEDRNRRYREAFRQKWGDPLTRLFIFGETEFLDVSQREELSAHRYKSVVESLLAS